MRHCFLDHAAAIGGHHDDVRFADVQRQVGGPQQDAIDVDAFVLQTASSHEPCGVFGGRQVDQYADRLAVGREVGLSDSRGYRGGGAVVGHLLGDPLNQVGAVAGPG